ncbi:hypothetical protein [Nocardia arthritidis]|uniref:Uncharacterized protein n=1 Tax=Nocardia arthritidis TaxID=228602 RepID=A0A6G9Y7D1_9NOCA|nr:hypothetical protein [Nocardia arthritidis]QIS09044.1 hypothetical protein F5544_05660 [Nocardia arthritidis]
MAVDDSAPSLLNYAATATVRVEGKETEVGWAKHAGETHAKTTFTLSDFDPSVEPMEVELSIDDQTAGVSWTAGFSWPLSARVDAPVDASDGRLAMLTDPVFVAEAGSSIQSWVSPITLDPIGFEVSYVAAVAAADAPSMWEYEVDAMLRSSAGSIQMSPSVNTSATQVRAVFQYPVPLGADISSQDFELTLVDRTAGITWSTQFAWQGPRS